MAMPDNGHHVHDAGYRSDRGEPDTERMLMEVADEIEQVDGVQDAQVAGMADPHVEVTFDGSLSLSQAQDLVDTDVGPTVDEWGCSISVSDTRRGVVVACVGPM